MISNMWCTSDVREPCPPLFSFTRIWAIAFIILYPVGIPVFSILVMMYMGVHRLAEQKVTKLEPKNASQYFGVATCFKWQFVH